MTHLSKYLPACLLIIIRAAAFEKHSYLDQMHPRAIAATFNGHSE